MCVCYGNSPGGQSSVPAAPSSHLVAVKLLQSPTTATRLLVIQQSQSQSSSRLSGQIPFNTHTHKHTQAEALGLRTLECWLPGQVGALAEVWHRPVQIMGICNPELLQHQITGSFCVKHHGIQLRDI